MPKKPMKLEAYPQYIVMMIEAFEELGEAPDCTTWKHFKERAEAMLEAQNERD